MEDLLKKLQEQSVEQIKLLEKIANKKEEVHWLKVLSALGPISSALLIASVGWYFTHKYNQQQYRISEIQVIEKFSPLVNDSNEYAQLTALATLMSLDNEDLAVRTVSTIAFRKKTELLKTLLYNAIGSGDLELISRISRLVKPSSFATTIEEPTPLEYAIYYGDVETVRILVEKGFNSHDLALIEASAENEIEIARFLLDKETDPNTNYNGKTPLWMAVKKGNLEMLRLLLNQPKIKVDLKNNDGLTALAMAVSNEERNYPKNAIVKLLISKGANLNVSNEVTNHPLLFYAIREGDFPTFKALFEGGASLSKEDEHALHFAVEHEQLEAARYLLDHNVSPNIKDIYGETPVYRCHGNTPEIFSLLVERGAELNIQNSSGQSLLHSSLTHYLGNYCDSPRERAVYNINHFKQIEQIVRAGANVNASYNNYTPLYLATYNGEPKVVSLLLKSGAGVNEFSQQVVSVYEITPLMLAAERGSFENVRLLLSYKADRNIKDERGKRAFDFAKDIGSYEHLLARGDTLTEEDKQNEIRKIIEVLQDTSIIKKAPGT